MVGIVDILTGGCNPIALLKFSQRDEFSLSVWAEGRGELHYLHVHTQDYIRSSVG